MSKRVKSWFSDANSDLLTAKLTFNAGDKFYIQSAFHCQQAIEKSIKGFLVYLKVRFDKTHDLEKLAETVLSIDSNILNLKKDLSSLNRYAVAYRYPDSRDRELTTKELQDALTLAESIFHELSQKVKFTDSLI